MVRTLIKASLSYLWLLLGAAVLLWISAEIDVSFRRQFWQSRPDMPNIDPGITYTFALFAWLGISFVSGFIELFRLYVFERDILRWWKMIIIGVSYTLFFTKLPMRHIIGYELASIVVTVFALLFNPVFLYYLFGGFKQPNIR